ncbi:hypothetical protein [Rhodovarius crocodyli]|uniref:hypothetical protein n=1 Tax=Rhodovarius crocodyli TaxID=1979269 RepID=UPI0013E2EE05|nr:hypothetical protein [Rhodovarius crocodyli]
MAANFSITTPAFLEMLQEAKGRYDVVERAIVKATENAGRAPSVEAVLAIIRTEGAMQ